MKFQVFYNIILLSYTSLLSTATQIMELQLGGIDVIKEIISYDEFYRKYLITNKPCLISNACELTKSWRSQNEWVTFEEMPNLKFFHENFGMLMVPVADCAVKFYDAQVKGEMSMSDYVDYWAILNQAKNDENNTKCLYLKDWHFVKHVPDYHAYTLPIYFESDYINEYWTEGSKFDDDYRFVYMGPKGSWTPFHADVFRSFSWSANICGTKLWYFVSPEDATLLLKDGKNMPYDIRDLKHRKDISIIEVIQNKGDIMFVPSLWYHQVHNLEDTISINHNWANAANLGIIFDYLQDTMNAVKIEIEDCRDMPNFYSHCQIMLKALHGMNFLEFKDLLIYIGSKRIERSKCKKDIGWELSFELEVISKVLQRLLDSEDYKVLKSEDTAANSLITEAKMILANSCKEKMVIGN